MFILQHAIYFSNFFVCWPYIYSYFPFQPLSFMICRSHLLLVSTPLMEHQQSKPSFGCKAQLLLVYVWKNLQYITRNIVLIKVLNMSHMLTIIRYASRLLFNSLCGIIFSLYSQSLTTMSYIGSHMKCYQGTICSFQSEWFIIESWVLYRARETLLSYHNYLISYFISVVSTVYFQSYFSKQHSKLNSINNPRVYS